MPTRAFVLFTLFVFGCSDSAGGGVPVGTPDAAADAGSDADQVDAAPDATPDAALPEPTPPDVVDLGTVSSGTPFEISIPSGALGFHVVVRRAAGGVVGVERLTSPSGQDVVVNFTVIGAGGPSTLGYDGVGAATVPQNPATSAMPVAPGPWVVTPSSQLSGEPLSAKLYIQKTDDGTFHGGLLDLMVYLPAGLELSDLGSPHPVTPESAPDDPAIKLRIDSFYAALGELYGIGRGAVRFVGIDAAFRTITDESLLYAAFAQTQPPDTGTALHVVLANGVTVWGIEVWGISSGIPGGAVEAGHPASAVALSVSLGFSAVGDGWTLLHEMGHFAGLFHSSQPDPTIGVMSDPLTDTPECTTFSYGCPDGKNVMFAAFWGASNGVGIVASDQQRAIVRGSPLYRAFPSGTMELRRQPPIASGPERRHAELALAAGLCGTELRQRRTPR
jgi:hypothetical protein